MKKFITMPIIKCPLCGEPWDLDETVELSDDETLQAGLPADAVVCYDCYCELTGPVELDVAV